jgi:tetratricopeptide (TPR) repeat protein
MLIDRRREMDLPAIAGYEVIQKIGQGGMGVVYQARHKGLHRVVALKMIRAGTNAEPEELARFRSEAEAVAALQHPNIVQIYEIGEQDGSAYAALEFVDGGSLAQKLAGVPQPARISALLIETLARAVAFAHDRGIVHRDLKPSNILLASNRSPDSGVSAAAVSDQPTTIPKITDFGLAKRVEDESGQTRTGQIVGTPSYMAPEQTLGDPRQVGRAADIYALGAVLYETLTGRPPFKAETMLETLNQVRNEEAVPPRRLVSKVPHDLETICLKCLEKEPGKRYADAAALADDLKRFQAGEPIRARPVGVFVRTVKWVRRRPMAAAFYATAFAAIAALVGGVLGHNTQLAQERNQTQANLDKAKQVVEDCFVAATENPLLQGPNMQPVRKLLYDAALKYYQGFIQQRPNDASMQAELAHNYRRVALITSEIGSKEEAIEAYQQARTILDKVLQADPTDRKAQNELAKTYNGLGVVQRP